VVLTHRRIESREYDGLGCVVGLILIGMTNHCKRYFRNKTDRANKDKSSYEWYVCAAHTESYWSWSAVEVSSLGTGSLHG